MADEGKLFVGGLSFETNEESLAAAFNKYGNIEKGRFKPALLLRARRSVHDLSDVTRSVRWKVYTNVLLFVLVDVIRDKETGRSRGFGFVKYDNVEDAKDAMTAMNGKVCQRFYALLGGQGYCRSAHIFVMVFRLMHFKCWLCRLWMVGLFVWMKQGRVNVPGEASRQAADSVAPGEEVGEATPEVSLRPKC